MRQVNRDELAYMIAQALRQAKPSVLNMLVDRRPDQQRKGRAMVALAIVDELRHLEVLSDRELPALMGERAFSVPLARMLGEDIPSGIPAAPVEPCSKHG